jgi:hypothetical protein
MVRYNAKAKSKVPGTSLRLTFNYNIKFGVKIYGLRVSLKTKF